MKTGHDMKNIGNLGCTITIALVNIDRHPRKRTNVHCRVQECHEQRTARAYTINASQEENEEDCLSVLLLMKHGDRFEEKP